MRSVSFSLATASQIPPTENTCVLIRYLRCCLYFADFQVTCFDSADCYALQFDIVFVV